MGANYHRVSRLVVLPDYQGIGVGKCLLNAIADMYTSQMPHLPFTIVTSNPQLIRGNLGANWKVKRYGHSGRVSANNEGYQVTAEEYGNSASWKRMTVSLQYIPRSARSGGQR